MTRRALPALVTLAVLALPATGAAESPTVLRARGAALAAQERSALLELYALDSRLERARSDLAAVQARMAALERERAAALVQLGAARQTLASAQARLAEQVRLLYVQDSLDPLAVLLGASSIDEAITGLDGLSRAADTTAAVAEGARQARTQVAELVRTLSERRQSLARLRRAAAQRAAELASARSERLAYIERLRAERRLTEREIAEAEARVRAAQAAAAAETLKAEAVPSIASVGARAEIASPAPDAAEPPAPPAFQPTVQQAPVTRGQRTLTVLATAYTLPGTTATGLPVGPGVVAVDPTVIPLGTRMTIPGYGEGVAADTGPAIRGLRIDVWVPTRRDALLWGWRTVTIVLH